MYLSRILTSDHAVIVYVTCVAALVVALPSLRRRDWGRAVRVASMVLLAGGILAVLSTTLRGSSAPTLRVNLVPGASIVEVFSDDYRNAVENVVGNVLLFLPLGFFATLLTRWRTRWVTLCGAALSTAIEVTQRALGDRWVDVDDVLLNTCGTFLGAVAAGVALRRVASRSTDRDAGSADALPPGAP